MKIIVKIFILVCSLTVIATLVIANDLDSAEVVASFRKSTAEFMASYTNEPRVSEERIPENKYVPSGWRLRKYILTKPHKIDVQEYLTTTHPLREDANKDKDFSMYAGVSTHRHTYSLQDGRWVVTSRMHSRTLPDGTKYMWETCKNIGGCIEQNMPSNLD
jgi:hypothetical protein